MILSTRNLTETHMEVVVVEQFPPVFVPDDCRPGFPLGNAKKHDLVAQHVLVVEVRGLGNLSSLETSLVTDCERQLAGLAFLPAYHSLVLLLAQCSV